VKPSLRVAFLHPDLGIGGAERLVVDAARQLQSRGHRVVIHTAHHEPARAFGETLDGTLDVRVRGDFLPMHVAGRLRAPCAIARTAVASTGLARSGGSVDVVFCDLVAHVIPLLRLFTRAPIVFYCHFPDRLLTPRRRFPYGAYRWPIDRWEEFSTGLADRILVNSHFTASVFRKTFRSLSDSEPEVVYPGVEIASPAAPRGEDEAHGTENERISIVSVSRYEPTKNVKLAVDALALLRRDLTEAMFSRVRMVIAGGYDERLAECQRTLGDLEAQVERLQLGAHVEFRRSISDAERHRLLAGARAVVHTAENEHFGYVPVEAMAVGRPVLAVASGGVTETVRHGETGFLCAPNPEACAAALARLILDPERAEAMGRAGREHVARHFSRDAFGARLERILLDLVAGRRGTE
jgi:alpha-1,3/alpha-1,6-mannosyltransferase